MNMMLSVPLRQTGGCWAINSKNSELSQEKYQHWSFVEMSEMCANAYIFLIRFTAVCAKNYCCLLQTNCLLWFFGVTPFENLILLWTEWNLSKQKGRPLSEAQRTDRRKHIACLQPCHSNKRIKKLHPPSENKQTTALSLILVLTENLDHNDTALSVISPPRTQYYTEHLESGISVVRDLKTRRGGALLDRSPSKPQLFMKYLREIIRGPILHLKSWWGCHNNLMTSRVILAQFSLEFYSSFTLWWSPSLSAGGDLIAGV